MKKLLFIMFVLMITSLSANPLIPAFISEIYCEDNEWTVELYDYHGYGLENLDGCENTKLEKTT